MLLAPIWAWLDCSQKREHKNTTPRKLVTIWLKNYFVLYAESGE
jgi:hypothetical protein